jgi:hypothetical protein
VPHIMHDMSVFAIFSPLIETPGTTDRGRPDVHALKAEAIRVALGRVPEEYRTSLVGPQGGANSWRSLALLPTGSSARVADREAAFMAVAGALFPIAWTLEAVRLTFGGDGEITEILYTTDDLVGLLDGTVLTDPPPGLQEAGWEGVLMRASFRSLRDLWKDR